MSTETYVPTHCHSVFSMLDGFGSPKQNAKRAKALGLPALAMTDHGNIYGHMQHIEACKKEEIKPILGAELYISYSAATIKKKENRNHTHIVVLAKNHNGWLNLMKLITQTNDPDFFYYRPRIALAKQDDIVGLEDFLEDIIGFSGHQGSHLANNLFADVNELSLKEFDPERIVVENNKIKLAYGGYAAAKNPEYYRRFLKDGWLEDTCDFALKLERMFGKGNFFVELQDEYNSDDATPLYVQPIILECLREVSKETGIPGMASLDAHYAAPEDAKSQEILMMVNMKETEDSIRAKLESEEDNDMMAFFGCKSFYIHSYEEMAAKFTEQELQTTVDIASQIEEFELKHEPYVPEFIVPNDVDLTKCEYPFCKTKADQYLMYLCIQGAQDKEPWLNTTFSREMYWDRLKEEMEIICGANLSNYFLIVWDICQAADNRPSDNSFDWYDNHINGAPKSPVVRGVARGSVAGCVVAYFTDITCVDSLEYDLLFSRFYNAARSKKQELPDIDLDFSVDGREWVIEYLKHKYGSQNVAQIITFQRMQGKAALKDVFRVRGIDNGFEIANQISNFIPEESAIADELQTIRDGGQDEYGLIQYALDNIEGIKEWSEDDKYKDLFKQAIRCEGIKRSSGRHPAGVVITPRPSRECFPLSYDPKSKEQIIGVDMNDVAKMGGIKFDILGTAILDKLQMVQNLVNAKTTKRTKTK